MLVSGFRSYIILSKRFPEICPWKLRDNYYYTDFFDPTGKIKTSAVKDISREGVPRKPAADILIKIPISRCVK